VLRTMTKLAPRGSTICQGPRELAARFQHVPWEVEVAGLFQEDKEPIRFAAFYPALSV
jgi:hypothetical protein